MIVKNPIGAIKIGNLSHRLTVGKAVPVIVLEFWKKTKQLEALMKAGAIGEKLGEPKKPSSGNSGNNDSKPGSKKTFGSNPGF